MENLEENQSHLILPSLEQLPVLELSQQTTWMIWMNILYKRLLNHNNVLVVRYTLEHFLKHYAAHNLSLEVLTQLLNAFNNTNLYNNEGYFIPTDNIGNFIQKQQVVHFITAIADVKWKSVPLHFWLKQLHKNKEILKLEIHNDLLLQLASRIRMLQNPSLRRRSIALLNLIFKKNVNNMNLQKYITFITTLHNASDAMNNEEINELVLSKMICYNNVEDAELKFTQRFYEVLAISTPLNNDYFNRILKFLETVPTGKHSWMRFYIVFEGSLSAENNKNSEDTEHDENSRKSEEYKRWKDFCKKHYNLDLSELLKKTTINDVIEELRNKLTITNKEKNIIKRCYDFFALNNVNYLNQISDWEVMLDHISRKAAKKLLDLYYSTDTIPLPLDNFMAFVERHLSDNGDWYEFLNIFLDVIDNYNLRNSHQECAEKLLLLDLENYNLAKVVLENKILNTEFIVRGILIGDAKTGEARVEEIYNQSVTVSKLVNIRKIYMDCVYSNQLDAVLKCLKNKSLEIGHKKTRYYENSTEHRLQMRIACAISYLSLFHNNSLAPSSLLELLSMESNHSNVNIIYEYLIAKFSEFHEILDNIKQVTQYTASKQVSLISIAHTHCILHAKCISNDKVVLILNNLVPLTMGSNFQTRLYSQLAVYNIIENYEELRNSDWINISKAIKDVLGENTIHVLMEDIRIKIIGLDLRSNAHLLYDTVMFVANAPFDEILNENLKDLEKSKALFSKKICNYAKSISAVANNQIQTTENPANHLQRKLNPSNNVLWKHDLTLAHTINCENELYVVASLIDKLPNLGGLARTCEVLGIGNLVLDTKSCIEKPEFKNLSMTAENSLNILEVKVNGLPEFLMQKQLEGFEIVGAEQTANSVSFVDFKFPKKSILLLGHEKEGIPPHLLKFLNYAVEIPQSGMVRSLNVHVTGALFMWEYCKQHNITNLTT